MKKAVLFFLLCISVSYSQTLPSLETCINDLNQPVSFDLTLKYAEILGSNNSSNYQITFHYSQFDATNGVGAIQNPEVYFPSPQSQVIFARSFNTVNYTFYIESFNFIVNQNPIVNPTSLLFCGTPELALFNLETSIPGIIGNNTDPLTITFFLSEADANANINQIPSGPFIPIAFPSQDVFARAENNVTGCFSIKTVTLVVSPDCVPITCPTANQLTLSNSTGTSADLNWSYQTAPNIYIGYWQISIVPLGQQPDSNSAIQTQSAPFSITGLTPNVCYSVYIRTACFWNGITVLSDWSAPFDFCTMDCTNNGQCPEQLTCIAFIDENNNGVMDSGELNFSRGSYVYEMNNSGELIYGSSNNGSLTIFEPNPTNSFDIHFEVNEEFSMYYSSPTSYTDITVPTGSGSTIYYFPITIVQEYVDVEVSLATFGISPRPGFTYTNKLIYKNNGYTNITSGLLHFTKDDAVSIVSVSQDGTLATSTGFDYTFTDLAPFETRTMTITMEVPTMPTVNLGAVLTNVASIEPLDNEENIENNTTSLSQVVIGSYDPNDKNESHGGKIEFENFTADDFLYYTIRFENTGTAAAEFIRVEDSLESSLDETTFEMLNASHSFNVRRTGNQLVWHFFDINLPPSVENSEIGKGFVQFKIKPKAGFAIGDIIENTAEIYFDYNPAIITNTMESQFVESLSVAGFSSSSVVLYPNPTNDTFYIQLNGADVIKTIAVYDVVGKRILQKENVNLNSTSVAVSGFNQGIYFVEITTITNAKALKKLVIR
ncbi:T9SS type A sorting domain-containing protein [Flavobacterium sp.]|uniref:DUF7619 domain-containing protein n=1 Tax=Flavobacterium sp. TaxID=239 RepID=UPI00262CC06E|nr:T9SS type A sorting domain-containing protein [Flavobacterium sp.]MDD2985113.1 T9SS type A sorting domain-containing protein [Flavobacterium sp.]